MLSFINKKLFRIFKFRIKTFKPSFSISLKIAQEQQLLSLNPKMNPSI